MEYWHPDHMPHNAGTRRPAAPDPDPPARRKRRAASPDTDGKSTCARRHTTVSKIPKNRVKNAIHRRKTQIVRYI